MLSCLFIDALWSPAGKGLTYWLLLVILIVFVTFPSGILGQVWYLVVSFPDLCRLSYLERENNHFCMRHIVRRDLILILIKLHEDIPNGY